MDIHTTYKQKSLEQKKEETWNGMIYGFCVLMFSVVVLFVVHRYIQADLAKEADKKHIRTIGEMGTTINDVIMRVEARLVYISRLYAVRQILLKEDPVMRKEVERLFSILLQKTANQFVPRFDQIRLLDIGGMERVRVDQSPAGSGVVCPISRLQDKSGRYYFKAGGRLSKNQIYVSPLDLNVEHGKIEIPHKPMIRFVIPVHDNNGVRLGFIVFNYLAGQLFDILDSIIEPSGNQWFLLNEQGYYLRNPDPGKAFGFMFPDRGIGFFSDHPQLWVRLDNGTDEKISSSKGVYYRKKIEPFINETHFSVPKSYTWSLLMFVSQKSLYANTILFNRGIYLLGIIVAPILFVLGWFLGRSRARNRWFLKSLVESATRDGLTGLFNYREAVDRLRYQIKVSKRQDLPLSVVFIDLNDLKPINDKFGHESGDRLIISAAQSINDTIRTTDIPSRMGGDEFLVLFPDLETGDVQSVMERIETSYAEKGRELFGKTLSLSWGVSSFDREADTAEKLIAKADAAMYEMKKRIKARRTHSQD